MKIFSCGDHAFRIPSVAISLLSLSLSLVAGAQTADRSLEVQGPPVVPLDTRWPTRTAVAMFAVRQVNATAVESTSDGWVVWTPLLSGFEAREDGPTTRLRVRPLDALKWVDSVRVLLLPSSDSLIGTDGTMLPSFGRGQTSTRPSPTCSARRETH